MHGCSTRAPSTLSCSHACVRSRLSETQISQLPVTVVTAKHTRLLSYECAICLECAVVGDRTTALPCLHTFHAAVSGSRCNAHGTGIVLTA